MRGSRTTKSKDDHVVSAAPCQLEVNLATGRRVMGLWQRESMGDIRKSGHARGTVALRLVWLGREYGLPMLRCHVRADLPWFRYHWSRVILARLTLA